MKRTITYISIALLLITGFCTSCQKEPNSLEENGAPANEVIVKATIGSTDTKVSFKEDSNTLKAAWEDDDKIIGWDEEGNEIELEIAGIEDNGTAIFKTAEGSAAIPASGKVYMIYAPGKSKSDIGSSSLEYDLSDQGSGKLPALMTATGEVSDNVLSLTFANRLAIVAVKNPTFPVTEATAITGLKLSGSNVQTKATFSMDGGALKMESSVPGAIARGCNFITAAGGTANGTVVYFAVLPNSTAAEVTVSTSAPTGYQMSFSDKSFAAGRCYQLKDKVTNKQIFTFTVPSGIIGGTITTSPSGSVAWGETVTVTVTPETGYELATLAYNDGSEHDIKESKSFTMPQSAVTISGSFKKTDYAVTATDTETPGTYIVTGGSYTVKNSSGTDATTAQMGDAITVSVVPDDGYSGGTVTVKKTGTEETVDFDATNNTFIMPAAGVTITVTFTHDIYAIAGTVSPTSSGTVKFKKSGSDDGITQAYYGDEITVEDTPAAGYELESIKWKEEGGSETDITSTKTFTMPVKDVTVTVTFKIPVTGVTLNKTSTMIAPGKTETLTVTITPSNATDNTVTWSSSNPAVATVDATGNITAIAAGTAVITATSNDDLSIKATCTVTVSTPDWPDAAGKLPGLFTVGIGDDGEAVQVRFSKGNLVAAIDATGAPTAWKFAANQYDYIGGNVANTSIGNKSGDVDLFGWSTSSDNYGINTSGTSDDYKGSFYDWGKAYCEKNNITPDNTWRTLSKDEWMYLFNTRTMPDGKVRYSDAVTGVSIEGITYNGVFLYPDGYSGKQVGDNTDKETWTWDKINSAGIVFLPAAGSRYTSNVKDVGDVGNYWTSSSTGTVGATSLSLRSGSSPTSTSGNRSRAYSVRLITEY